MKIAAAGSRILRGPYRTFRNTTKTPLNIVAMLSAVGIQEASSKPKAEGAAEVRQADADQAGIQRGDSRAQKDAQDPDVRVGSESRRSRGGLRFGPEAVT